MSDSCLITGGAGFIGVKLAEHCLARGDAVTIVDNFARQGARQNIEWLRQVHGNGFQLLDLDIRKPDERLVRAMEEVEAVFHLAAQVAVTTSVEDPRDDFEINALGTFNVLEAVRRSSSGPVVVYSSTNKVYGRMADVPIDEGEDRYSYADRPHGVAESQPLDFYSPYGCSKGAGDQYVVDYARIYGLRTIVFRQSCIYGPRQFGKEDQGWVAWFAIRAMQGLPITIYGDGKQVRDVLYIDDLIAAFDQAVERVEDLSGRAYNIGGGSENTLSLRELIRLLEKKFGRRLEHSFDEWRPGDQRVYISDIRKAESDLGWRPMVNPEAGLDHLVDWLRENESLFIPEHAKT